MGGGASGAGSSSLLEMDPLVLIQLLDLKEHGGVESLWSRQPQLPPSDSAAVAAFCSRPAHAPSRRERERRPQPVRRSAPDSAVLIRLKAQMAEVRNRMCDVKSQVREAQGAEPRLQVLAGNRSHPARPGLCQPEPDLLGGAVWARSARSGEEHTRTHLLLATSRRCERGSPLSFRQEESRASGGAQRSAGGDTQPLS